MVTSTPKVADFFGGATLGTHHYEGCDRGCMALSLDSMYYHQTPDNQANNGQDFLNSLQENSRQQQIHVQEYPHYSAFRGPDLYQQAPQEEPKETCNLHLPTMADGEMRNWVSRNYPNGHALEQKMGICLDDNGGESGPNCVMGYGDLQSLSLSMSPGTQSSCITGSQHIAPAIGLENKKRDSEKVAQKQIVHRKSIDTFGQRTSQYRGVTRLIHFFLLIYSFSFLFLVFSPDVLKLVHSLLVIYSMFCILVFPNILSWLINFKTSWFVNLFVTRHRWTGRYEAHLWDNSCKKEGQSRKGRQG